MSSIFFKGFALYKLSDKHWGIRSSASWTLCVEYHSTLIHLANVGDLISSGLPQLITGCALQQFDVCVLFIESG